MGSLLHHLTEPPVSTALGVASFLVVPWLWVRGFRLTRRSTQNPGHPDQSRWMIRGIRDWILAGAAISFGVGLLLPSTPWIIFGAIFLGEELVETGVMLLALRRRGPAQ